VPHAGHLGGRRDHLPDSAVARHPGPPGPHLAGPQGKALASEYTSKMWAVRMNLVSHAGLVPVMALAQRAELGDLVAERVRPGGRIRAPSTLGSHLRCYTWGNVSQLEKAGREFPARLAGQAPLLPGADTLAFTST